MQIAALVFFLATPCGAQRLQFTRRGLSRSDGSLATLKEVTTTYGKGIEVDFNLVENGWANLSVPLRNPNPQQPVSVAFKVSVPCTLELKFVTVDGSTFGQRIAVKPNDQFQRVTIYADQADYWWGPGRQLDKPATFEVAISGANGAGRLTLLGPAIVKPGAPSSFGPPVAHQDNAAGVPLMRAPYHGPLLDPDRELPGYGTRQRRAEEMTPEDPLVLEWLKAMQDTGTPDKKLLTSTPGGDEIHMFNNVLAAIAFIRHHEQERVERILDYFRDASTDQQNNDPTAQQFYLHGEPRGFYQRVSLKGNEMVSPMHATGEVDRWMGDMAWLTLACLDYQRTFNSPRYADLTKKLTDLLKSWYIADPNGRGGYVQHGWRKGDTRLHEDHGHHEGNVDCYAVFTLIDERELANQIRTWLDAELAGRNDLPLDLYTWRVLAFDGQQSELLDIPDFDLRYRKAVDFNGREIVGPFSGANGQVNNIWLEGCAHMACAYSAADNASRANFYANQLDLALIDQDIGGKPTRSLPYTVNGDGGYEWVKPDEGFVSTAAWYVLAKHRFNPLRVRVTSTNRELPPGQH